MTTFSSQIVSNKYSFQTANNETRHSLQSSSFLSADTTLARREHHLILSPIISTSKLPSPLLISPNAVRFKPASAKSDSSGSDFENGYGLVDENMIILRKRIRDIEIAEGKNAPPSHWMEWEKRYHAKYWFDVCEFVGLVQTMLMKTRPALAIGLVGLIAMSLPTSAVLILLHLVNASTRPRVFSVLQAVLAALKGAADRCCNTRTLIFYLVLLSYLYCVSGQMKVSPKPVGKKDAIRSMYDDVIIVTRNNG